jgi:hypothetical protein
MNLCMTDAICSGFPATDRDTLYWQDPNPRAGGQTMRHPKFSAWTSVALRSSISERRLSPMSGGLNFAKSTHQWDFTKAICAVASVSPSLEIVEASIATSSASRQRQSSTATSIE